jgi:hypothetical protein
MVYLRETTMPRNKDLKRLVRARMTRTGEAYTTARAHITRRNAHASNGTAATAAAVDDSVIAASTGPVAPAAQSPAKPDYEKLAGMRDEIVKEKTGCTWERWVYALDRLGADKLSHREIAALVHDTYKVGPWWTQTVAVGYERIKGLRARGQQRDGSYEASKSRTFNVPVTTLFEAWKDGRTRKRWMDGTKTKVRSATAPKSMRLDWGDGGSIVVVGFISKGPAKSSVAIEHARLPDKETADRIKEYWSERFDALAEVLADQ